MIASSSNPKIRQIHLLNTKAKARRESGLFAAEGRKLFLETPSALREAVYVSQTFEKEHPEFLNGTSYEVIEDRLFEKLCDTRTPQGILTLARMPRYERNDLLIGGTPLLLVLENVQDPGNMGTILRTAEGAGVTGVLMSRDCADLFQPKVIRSTMGSVYRVPFRVEEDLSEAVRWMKQQGITTYAAHLRGTSSYTEGSYRDPCAFYIGNEGNGLSETLSATADRLIRIPMEGKVESLNAAVAASILMYAAHAQRH